MLANRRRYLYHPSRSFPILRVSYAARDPYYYWTLKCKSTVSRFEKEAFFGWLPRTKVSVPPRCTLVIIYLVYLQSETELMRSRSHYGTTSRLIYSPLQTPPEIRMFRWLFLRPAYRPLPQKCSAQFITPNGALKCVLLHMKTVVLRSLGFHVPGWKNLATLAKKHALHSEPCRLLSNLIL